MHASSITIVANSYCLRVFRTGWRQRTVG